MSFGAEQTGGHAPPAELVGPPASPTDEIRDAGSAGPDVGDRPSPNSAMADPHGALAIYQPGLERIKALVLDSLPSPNSRRAYDIALSQFLTWYRSRSSGEGLCKATVQRFGRELAELGLSPATINLRLTAVRRLAAEAADNGLLPQDLAAGISRVKGVKSAGVRTGIWLTKDEAERILKAPPPTTKGIRDQALFAILIGGGLRRDEISRLDCGSVQQREGRWAVIDIRGKGNRIRTVPIPGWVKAKLDAWLTRAGISSGLVFRSMKQCGQIQNRPVQGGDVRRVVLSYARKMGISAVAPHDLRRTFAKLAHKGGAPLEQIQISLGHASIQTTERYLGIRQNLTDAPCDHLGLDPLPKSA